MQVPKRIQIAIDFVIEVLVAMVGFFAMYLAAIALNYFNDIVDTKRLAPIPILYAMRGVEYAIFIADLAGFGYFSLDRNAGIHRKNKSHRLTIELHNEVLR